MADESETHKEVCDEMRSFGNVPPPMFAWSYLADRAEAAHKRELAAKDDERLKVSANYEAVIAAKDRIISAKDAEIARLKRENFDLNGCLLAEQELAEKRNSLIKELADDLSGYLCESECNGACASFGHCCSQTSHQIVAKAREVVNG